MKNIHSRKKKGYGIGRFFLRSAAFAAIAVFIAAAVITGYRGYLYLTTSSYFSVQMIALEGNIVLLDKDIIRLGGVEIGDNIFSIDIKEISKSLERYPWIKEAEVERGLPDTVYITIVERIPFAIVESEESYLIDSDGVILGKLNNRSDITLPVITERDRISIDRGGERILSEAFWTGREIISAAQKSSFAKGLGGVRNISIVENNKVMVVSHNSHIRLFFDRYNLTGGFEKLDAVAEFIADKPVEYIDISYKRQVVVKSLFEIF